MNLHKNILSYLLIFIFGIALIFLSSCSSNQDATINEANNNVPFNNPYSFAGKSHNKIVNDFLSSNQSLELNNTLSRSKYFLEKENYYQNISTNNSTFIKNFTNIVNPVFDRGLSKITNADWIDSLFNDWVTNGNMTVNRKNQLKDFINVILTADADTNMINNYCLNIPATIDDTTKAIIFMSASIYNASQRLWQKNNLGKQNKIQLTIIAADAIGGAIGGAVYGIDAWLSDSDWSWGHFASSIIGGAAFTSIGKIL